MERGGREREGEREVERKGGEGDRGGGGDEEREGGKEEGDGEGGVNDGCTLQRSTQYSLQ